MKPPCPVCVAEVEDAIAWPTTVVGWLTVGVIVLRPCGHELRGKVMETYREAMAERRAKA